MRIVYKIIVPVIAVLVIVIALVALLLVRSIEQPAFQEEFFSITDSVFKKTDLLTMQAFVDPASASSQAQFSQFTQDVSKPTIARLTIWDKQKTIVYSDLASVIGFHAANQTDVDRALMRGEPFYTLKDKDTYQPFQSDIGRFMDIYVPLRISGEVVGVLQVHSVINAVLAPLQAVTTHFIYILIGSGLIIFFIIFLVTQYVIVMPVTKLKDASSAVSNGNLDARVSIVSRDEFGYLAFVFNEMVENIKMSKAQLSSYASNLEGKVRERTGELEKLLREKQELAGVVEGALDPIELWTYGATATAMRYVNPSWERLFGMSYDDVVNKIKPFIFDAVGHDVQMQGRLLSALNSATNFRERITYQRKDGTMIPVEVNISPVRDEKNQILFWVNFIHIVEG